MMNNDPASVETVKAAAAARIAANEARLRAMVGAA
jgi:hypothetical protein